MSRQRVKAQISQTAFNMEPSFEINGFIINSGDMVKVNGEYGSKFKVRGLTTNTLTGSTWVDVFEVVKGITSQFRAFKIEKIKRIPQKGKRAKRVV